jgi:SAM-dependent methyltransferase
VLVHRVRDRRAVVSPPTFSWRQHPASSVSCPGSALLFNRIACRLEAVPKQLGRALARLVMTTEDRATLERWTARRTGSRMASGDAPQPLPEVVAFYARGLEDQRLSRDAGLLERYRTQELLLRYLPPPPAVVLDIGGGTGPNARWLAARGYAVHLIDPVLPHLEPSAHARRRRRGSLLPAFTTEKRRPECSSDQVDAVLLYGPLYHLPERSDRLRALREARRVPRTEGLLLTAAISRFASALDGLVSHFFADPRYAPTAGRIWRTASIAVNRMDRISQPRACTDPKRVGRRHDRRRLRSDERSGN